ncbi:MAG: DUF3429 domain-containing protein [Pseudomonadota bacterium]
MIDQPALVAAAAHRRKTVWALSLGGVLPFLALTLFLVLVNASHPLHSLALDGLKTYGAVILSFLGGIRWGLALEATDRQAASRIHIASVVPSLLGWFALFLPDATGLAVLAVGFAAQGAWDSFAGQAGTFRNWFVQIRMVITTIVVVLLGLAFLVTV